MKAVGPFGMIHTGSSQGNVWVSQLIDGVYSEQFGDVDSWRKRLNKPGSPERDFLLDFNFATINWKRKHH